MSLQGARHCEAVVAFRSSGKSLSSELWFLLSSWHVPLRKHLFPDHVCSGVSLGMRWSASISVSPPPWPLGQSIHITAMSVVALIVGQTLFLSRT